MLAKIIKLISFFLFCFGLLPVTFAQDTVVEIDKIVIVAPEEQKGVSEENVQVQSHSQSVQNIPEVIRRVAGVHISQFGGLEAATAVSIRGSTANQVNLFIDGVPLATASQQGVGLEHFFLSDFDKIQIFKGFSPVSFGAQAVGGVINLQSKKIEEGFHHRYYLGFGSFLTGQAGAELSFGSEQNQFLLQMNYLRTKGNFSFLDNNGTPLNPNDDQKIKRQNNESQTIAPALKWIHQFDDSTKLTLSQYFFRVDHGVPGLENFQSQTANRSLTEWLGQLQIEKQGLWQEKFTWQDQVYWRVIKSQFSDLGGEIGLGAGQDNDNQTLILGNRFSGLFHLQENFEITTQIESVFESFLPKDYLAIDSIGSRSKRYQLNFSTSAEWQVIPDKLTLQPQVSSINSFYNINNDDPSLNASGNFFSKRTEKTYSANLNAQYHIHPDWILQTSFGRAVRLPLFTEMFGDQGFVLGNPQLVSEKSYKGDFGVIWQKDLQGFLEKLYANVNIFGSLVSDLIQFELANGLARAGNLGEASVYGFEVIGNIKFGQYFEWDQNYTFQRAKDQSRNPGNFLIGRPEHEYNSTFSFYQKPFYLAAHVNWIDNKYLDTLNTQRIDLRLNLGAQASYEFKEKMLFSLEVKNITDSQIVDAVGFPLPGRSVFGRVEVRF